MRAPATPDPSQYLGRVIDGDTITAAKHLGDGRFRFTLRSDDGTESTHEVGH